MRIASFLGACLLAATAVSAAPFAYQANDQNQVVVVDLGAGTLGARIQLAGTNPIGVAIRPAGDRVYVTDIVANTVTVISTASNSIVATIPVCTGPFIPAVNPAGTVLVVPCGSSSTSPGTEVDVVNLATNTVSARLTAGSQPWLAAWNPSGTRFYVANAVSGSISVFDASSNSLLQTFNIPGLLAIAFNPAGTRLYASRVQLNGNTTRAIVALDPNSGSTLATIPVTDDILWLSLNPSGTRLYAPLPTMDSIAIIDTATNTIANTLSTGASSGPAVLDTNADGSRLYVLLGSAPTSIAIYDANTLTRLNTIGVATNAGLIGNFVAAGTSSTPANTPGALSGQWWNHNESGWGIHFTERGNNVFAAWYTYDTSGNPKWYVSTCVKSTASACSGTIFQVTGPRFFGVPFNTAAVTSLAVGTLGVTFNGTDAGTMSYTVNGSSRTVAIERQPLQASGTAPAVNYTDIWWGGTAESGWGMALTQQFSTMFMAWYVYSDTGQPVWYVATIAVNAGGNGGSGTLFRTTGPPFGPSFNPNAVQSFAVGSATLTFSDGNNGTLSYTVNGVSGSKTITRQLF